MKQIRLFIRDIPNSDRKILIICAILFLLMSYVLYDDRLLQFMEPSSQAPVIGKITESKADVRQKSSKGLSWNSANQEDLVRMGDSIFTGSKSSANLKIQDGDIEVQENSLVSFKKYRDVDVTNLNLGQFRIRVNGNIKLMVKGEVLNLSGKNTEILASVDQSQKVQWKAVKGTTNISLDGKDTKLSMRDLPQEKKLSPFPPAPLRTAETPNYYWKVSDIYANNGERYRIRPSLPRRVQVSHKLEWKYPEEAEFLGELSDDLEFRKIQETFKTKDKFFEIKNLAVGENYWRVSIDGKDWSRTETILIQPNFTKNAPEITSVNQVLQLAGPPISFLLTWKGQPSTEEYFIEASRQPDFKPESTAVARTSQLNHQIVFAKAGNYFFRVRGKNALDQLSEGSVTSLTVMDRPLLAAPTLPKKDLAFKNPKKPINLTWKGPQGAKEFEVELVDSRTGKALTEKLTKSPLSLPHLENGPYSYQVTAIDSYGRKGTPSLQKPFTVARPQIREPAQSISAQFKDRVQPDYMNNKYPDNKIQIEGAGFTMYSTGQVQAGEAAPLAATMGVRTLNWWDNLGIEGFIKTKIFNYNSSASAVAPTSIEARVHERWKFGLDWRNLLREIQITLFLGAEAYSNKATNRYASSYNLIKAGTMISFPLANRWDTGGELVYGRGLDSSVKYEISGYLNFYLKKNWTYGAGYRIHLFEAGTQSTPTTLPFREGYVELYSSLRYLY